MNVLLKNLEKLLKLLFVFCTALLCLLMLNEGVLSVNTVLLKHQIAAE